MPRKLKYEKIEKNKYILTEAKISNSGYNYVIQFPAELGKKIKDKKIKVFVEVIED